MGEILTGVKNAEIMFGVQLDTLVQRHADHIRFPHYEKGISEMFPALKGHERAMVKALGRAAVERIELMDDLGHGGLAREIVEARRTLAQTPRQTRSYR